MGSPYPLAYDLKWPWLHLWPSTTEHAPLARRPLAHDFIAHADHEVARVMCFGDLMGLTGDRVPAIAPELAALFASADLVIGNCEAPVTHAEKDPRAFYLQRFRMATAYLREALDRLAIDPRRAVLSIANNHTGDRGAGGLASTRDRMAALGIAVAGLREQPITVREVRGRRIGVVAWTHWMNREVFGASAGVLRTHDVIGRDFHAVREQHALSTLIASPHWEWEFQHFPSHATVEQARALAAAGFDAIAGHHPHVVQPIAWFDHPRRSRGLGPTQPDLHASLLEHTVCQFSLGNLMARTLTWPHRWIAILELRVLADGRIAGYRSHPFVQLDGAPSRRLGARRCETMIVPLAAAPDRLREKIARRIGLLFE